MRRIGLLVVLLGASGCIHFGESFKLVNSSLLTSDYLTEPLHPEDVEVFIAEDVPPEECERVALLRAAPTATVVDRLRAEAGRLGANAVDLRDYRYPERDQHYGGEAAWNAIALHCPTP